MKTVVSVSLGSAAGDFRREVILAGETVRLSREGMDGDLKRARERLEELDGKVDAIGLGGVDLYLRVRDKQYTIGAARRLAEAVRSTPIVDGSGLKDTLEREVVGRLARERLLGPGTRVLLVSALDRFGMAEALVAAGCDCVFGDVIFNIGFDYPLRTLDEVASMAEKYRSRLETAPFHLLYPTGAAQDERKPDPHFARYYEEADVVAGDRHLLMRHLPARLPRKGIITTTTRPAVTAELKEAGVRWLATTTPEMDGVSGGTNLMEAALVAVTGGAPEALSPAEYLEWIQKLGWHGSLHYLDREER